MLMHLRMRMIGKRCLAGEVTDTSASLPERTPPDPALPERLETLRSELQRREKVSDLMLTMHSVLRDRYAGRSSAFDVSLVIAGAFLCATTFMDPAHLGTLQISAPAFRLVLGFVSALVFGLSLVGLRVDWKAKAAQHGHACRSLADLKLKSRELRLASAEQILSEAPEFLRAAAFVTSELEAIPDSQFPQLKAEHKMKEALSRQLDEYPGVPVRLLRIKLRLEHIRRAFARTTPRSANNVSNG